MRFRLTILSVICCTVMLLPQDSLRAKIRNIEGSPKKITITTDKGVIEFNEAESAKLLKSLRHNPITFDFDLSNIHALIDSSLKDVPGDFAEEMFMLHADSICQKFPHIAMRLHHLPKIPRPVDLDELDDCHASVDMDDMPGCCGDDEAEFDGKVVTLVEKDGNTTVIKKYRGDEAARLMDDSKKYDIKKDSSDSKDKKRITKQKKVIILEKNQPNGNKESLKDKKKIKIEMHADPKDKNE